MGADRGRCFRCRNEWDMEDLNDVNGILYCKRCMGKMDL